MSHWLVSDSLKLLERYGTHVPRYTSYPTAPVWQDGIGRPQAEEWFSRATADGRPVSLYVHVPFCRKLCWYCGCNMEVTRKSDRVDRYIDAVVAESERVAACMPGGTPGVVQVHWGGGTPTWLDQAQLARLWRGVMRPWRLEEGAEVSVEIHPAVTAEPQLETLAELGFNRVSMGVQDFDPEVQKAVNRVQPFDQTQSLIKRARELGFLSVNVDLMYGLPRQTLNGFSHTLDLVEELAPDRLALFGFAHLPTLKSHHSLIQAQDLPSSEDRLRLFALAMLRLEEADYRHIGLDHFARPQDELSVAQRSQTLRRNFMGYTTCRASHVVALGASSISEVGNAFLQNERDVDAYMKRIEDGDLAVSRGMALNADDLLRADVMQHLFCHLQIPKQTVAKNHGVDFDHYFASELTRLESMEADGLVKLDADSIRITRSGQVMLRNIAAVFDAYLHARPAGATPRSLSV